ncbi:hypothetical protein [Marisediminicola sp. LYQ134]|uniref:hypothetical protein n=1 Tax=Marisediminicola sp. LYQ134 TaxID=3391061 RepID=UPI0039834621
MASLFGPSATQYCIESSALAREGSGIGWSPSYWPIGIDCTITSRAGVVEEILASDWAVTSLALVSTSLFAIGCVSLVAAVIANRRAPAITSNHAESNELPMSNEAGR